MIDEIFQIALHSIISVSMLLVLTRIMGKKLISQLTFFDYVIGISIGSIAAKKAVDPAVSFTSGFTGLIVFTLFSLTLSFISLKSYSGRKLLDGTPTVLIENGRIIEDGLWQTKLTINDLLEECRQRDVFDISEIEFAILETSGKLSVLLKSVNRPLTPEDMKITAFYRGLCVNIIIDGEIIEEHLKAIKRDKNWLYDELAKKNIEDCSDVFFAYVDSLGVLNIHLKNVKLVNSNIRM